MDTVLLIMLFLLAPALVILLCRKISALGKIGPIFILYVLGAIIGNSGIEGDSLEQVQNFLSNATVPLAIPLLLFSCRMDLKQSRTAILSLVSGMVSVVMAIVVSYLLFGSGLSTTDDPLMGAKVGAMMSGTYTGGTVNMASIQKMLSVPEETFVIANTMDMTVSFVYLMILLGFGIKLFRKILPINKGGKAEESAPVSKRSISESVKPKAMDWIFPLLAAGVIVAVSYGIASLIDNHVEADVFMMVFILLLTTLGLCAAYIPSIKSMDKASPTGMYLIYVFSITVASMADFSAMSFKGGLYILLFLSVTVFGSLLLHITAARLLKIDSDTMVITSVSLINSPPFVPVVAEAMGNRSVMVTGLAAGIIGYAIGNYLGIGIFTLLSIL